MLNRQQQFGRKSEALAARHLKRNGYRILEQNYRTPAGEIDIIAQEGQTLRLYFLFEGNEAAIPRIAEMTVGQRYLLRGWEDIGTGLNDSWALPAEILYYTYPTLRPLDDEQLWYLPLEEAERLDFSDPDLAAHDLIAPQIEHDEERQN